MMDPDDESKLVLACGKNNNGKPFEEIGVVYDEDAGVYRIDGDFDAERYREAIGADGKLQDRARPRTSKRSLTGVPRAGRIHGRGIRGLTLRWRPQRFLRPP